MLHFAAVRAYSTGGFYHLLKESQINVAFRDELYRTARDVAEQAKLRENVQEIDLWVVYLAARGKLIANTIYRTIIIRVNLSVIDQERLKN